MKILDRKDAINRCQDERPIIVETAIHRVSCLNRRKGFALIPQPIPQIWDSGS
ncbi:MULTISPECIES: hypothetical protein [unclassified Nostoc]|uniref:hypothetical protein n=1 Tax=unclassified Nostoc TaxID=2593658 RepID=UPI0025FE542D|nr:MULTISPECIES: hypothetical protein [unclassified Nostoc]